MTSDKTRIAVLEEKTDNLEKNNLSIRSALKEIKKGVDSILFNHLPSLQEELIKLKTNQKWHVRIGGFFGGIISGIIVGITVAIILLLIK